VKPTSRHCASCCLPASFLLLLLLLFLPPAPPPSLPSPFTPLPTKPSFETQRLPGFSNLFLQLLCWCVLDVLGRVKRHCRSCSPILGAAHLSIVYLPQPMSNHQQLSPEPGKTQRCISEIRVLVIAAGSLACSPQPWKGYLEQALTLIDQLQIEISLHQPELCHTIGESIDCLAAKRSRNLSLSLDVPSSLRRSPFNLVFTSLANAIEIWEAAGESKSRHLLPKFNVVASVVKWGIPKQTRGTIAVSS
jgi:hypothetical protein